MAYEKKSFLAGIAVGRQLKGWSTKKTTGTAQGLTVILMPAQVDPPSIFGVPYIPTGIIMEITE